jgi:hypothetical protein
MASILSVNVRLILTFDRLDEIHAMEVPGRDRCYEPWSLQGRRCHRGSRKPMIHLDSSISLTAILVSPGQITSFL